ncbi:MAG: hypothetical protein FWF71_06410 [Actinomycetia bacterium]|nr:hypothetical protein [Actinomycetes bacterium]
MPDIGAIKNEILLLLDCEEAAHGNQQRFLFTLLGDRGDDDLVRAESLGGPFSAVDLGIVKYHFEIGVGREGRQGQQTFCWA